jgi:hypothetical protein
MMVVKKRKEEDEEKRRGRRGEKGFLYSRDIVGSECI